MSERTINRDPEWNPVPEMRAWVAMIEVIANDAPLEGERDRRWMAPIAIVQTPGGAVPFDALDMATAVTCGVVREELGE